jgi:formiminoglutamate deiminase
VTTWWAAHALLPAGLARDVRFEVAGGRFTAVTAGVPAAGASILPGVVLPGLADVHGHAFHRALRGRTHAGGGTFWTWRERMYTVAAGLDPDRYRQLAAATYAELALGGVTTVGEFHYLHHVPGGVPYAEPDAMGGALRAAAADAGVRLTLLDTAYLRGGLDGRELNPVQRRFADADIGAWAERVGRLRDEHGVRVGVAAHSVRAVARADLPAVVAAAAGRPLHAHLSEQPAENADCRAAYGASPTQVLAGAGFLTGHTTVVHATHLKPSDVALLGQAGVTVCACPSTEADLADGIGPLRALADAGAPLALGSDQHVLADLLAEARGLEAHERLASLQRGRFRPAELLAAATAHHALGWSDAGALRPGARADLVAVRLDTPRTAGTDPAQLLLVAGAQDVDTVVVDGTTVVAGGRHRLGDVGALLAAAVDR